MLNIDQKNIIQNRTGDNVDISLNRSIPVNYSADVVVTGGGMAGISAAIAAAKQGAKVILIERFAVTGGNATSGGVAAFCGDMDGQGEVFDEIVADLKKFNAIERYEAAGASVFHHGILAFILQELLIRYNVRLLLHSKLVDCIMHEDTITHAIIAGGAGLEAVSSRIFIDCSGEAVLARAAGLQTVKGREGDHAQLPMSMMFFVRHLQNNEKNTEFPDGFFDKLQTEDDLPMTSVWPDGPGSNAIKVKIPLGDSCDTESFSKAEMRGRKRIMQVLDFYCRVKGEKWLLDHCAPVIGIREGCRIVGDYTLKLDDLRAGRNFDDAVARGTYCLDGHSPDDDKRTYILDDLLVPPYQIPLRSLIAGGVKNMLAAGRCFSAEQLALSSARVMTTCSMMGQAAGIAAGMAIQAMCDVRDLDYLEIRKEVERRGAVL